MNKAANCHTSSVFSTRLVVALVDATVGSHLNSVKSTVKTARQVGNVDVKRELVSDELEELILARGLHKVGTRSNIGGVRAFSDELQGKGIATGSNTIGATVISTVNSAVLCA